MPDRFPQVRVPAGWITARNLMEHPASPAASTPQAKQSTRRALAIPTQVVGADIPVTIPTGLPGWLERVIHRRPHLRFLRDLALSGIEFAPFEMAYRALQA